MKDSTGKLQDCETAAVRLQLGIKVPLRDGVHLSATLYISDSSTQPAPCLFVLTPYTAQRNYPNGRYFAAHGYPFLVVDVRGRADSEGEFRPFMTEVKDGHDVAEWIATQPYCNGKVGMFSGSYEGFSQWATAKERPPHLVTIAPSVAAAPGVDFPMIGNIFSTRLPLWLALVHGRTFQEHLFADQMSCNASMRHWFESGRPFCELDSAMGYPSPFFQEWLSHPFQEAHWETLGPAAADFAQLDLPILTMTGCYDGDQPGALHYYRQHLRHAAPAAAAKHFLVLGPWDHGSTLTPKPDVGGIPVGSASQIDVSKLHREWYDWTMRGAARPEFLKRNVAYYVMGAEEWRYADTLDDVTVATAAFYLQSTANPTDVYHSGTLGREPQVQSQSDHYVYDPRDISLASLESTIDPESRIDQRMLHARNGKQLVYHSAPFEQEIEIIGFFRLALWIAIDQPDTDFRATVYEICLDGSAFQLSTDWLRARHRESLRQQKLIDTQEPLHYSFERFKFISRRIARGHRLRLVIGPVNSIFAQKNFNGGGVVSAESIQDARPVTVRVFHDAVHPSALHMPIGARSPEPPVATPHH